MLHRQNARTVLPLNAALLSPLLPFLSPGHVSLPTLVRHLSVLLLTCPALGEMPRPQSAGVQASGCDTVGRAAALGRGGVECLGRACSAFHSGIGRHPRAGGVGE